jgi:hypothetical protein
MEMTVEVNPNPRPYDSGDQRPPLESGRWVFCIRQTDPPFVAIESDGSRFAGPNGPYPGGHLYDVHCTISTHLDYRKKDVAGYRHALPVTHYRRAIKLIKAADLIMPCKSK